MNRRSMLNIARMTVLGLAVLPGHAVGQQESLKEQLLGTWALVSIDYVRQDGSRFQTFGADPKGISMFDGSGHRPYLESLDLQDTPGATLRP